MNKMSIISLRAIASSVAFAVSSMFVFVPIAQASSSAVIDSISVTTRPGSDFGKTDGIPIVVLNYCVSWTTTDQAIDYYVEVTDSSGARPPYGSAYQGSSEFVSDATYAAGGRPRANRYCMDSALEYSKTYTIRAYSLSGPLGTRGVWANQSQVVRASYSYTTSAAPAPTTTTTTVAPSTTTTTTTSPARSGNPCTDPSNPKYVCGWATVSDSGQVSNITVCAYEVCGSGFFGGQRKVLQTRQEAGGNVSGYGSGSYDFATNRFYPFGVDGAWFTGGDTWEGIRASLQATDTTSTTVRRRTTTTLPTDSDDEDSSTSTLPTRRTTTTTVARRSSTTTVAEPIDEDDGESEDDYAELSVRNEGTKFRVQVFSSFVDTDMVIRARSSGKATITWRFSTKSSGNHRFLTNRRLSGYVLSLWIDDERVDSLRIR